MDNARAPSRSIVAAPASGWIATRRMVLGGGAMALLTADVAAAERDDTKRIQAIIDAAMPGAVAAIPAGIWSVSGLVVTRAGITIKGQSGTILRQARADTHLIEICAPDVTLADLRMEGTANAARTPAFAVFTSGQRPAPRLAVRACVFSGATPALGFTNAVKLDEKCDGSSVTNCRFERLWGTASGFGYGVLVGGADQVHITGNIAVAPRGRGRHFIYLSAGCRDCVVENNDGDGFEFEAITVFSRDEQRTSLRNRIAGNTIRNAARKGSVDVAAISLFANVADTEIIGNLVIDSLGTGIAANGTNTRKMRGNRIAGNEVTNAGCIGIDVIAAADMTIERNTVSESSHAAPGVFANIRLASDGVTPVVNATLSNNRSSGRQFARSAFQLNQTRPWPRGTRLLANTFENGRVADVELGQASIVRDRP